MSSHRRPKVIPGLGWLALVAIFASALWLAARHWKIAEGFAGIEAFCAFLAVATHRICQPRQESLFERNAAG